MGLNKCWVFDFFFFTPNVDKIQEKLTTFICFKPPK